MTKIYYTILLGLSLCSIDLSAQSSSTAVSTATQTEKTLEEKLEGTYVMIHTSKKATQLLTTDTLIEIEKRRDENIDIYYVVSDYLTIKILPRKVINDPNFDPKKFQ